MNTRTLFKASVVGLSLLATATVAEAMPASSSVGSFPSVTSGEAQFQKAAIVVFRRRLRPRVFVRRPFRRPFRRGIIIR